MLTERQRDILNWVVQDYIELAEPISSEFLEKKHKLEISPATIRIEFQKLTKKGYLYQPHVSAGRVPTDKAYRFFVDNLFEKEFEEFEIKDLIKKEIRNTVKFLQSLTKTLAEISESLVLSYLKEEDIFWKEGWEEVLKEPEFFEKECILNFIEFLKNLEKRIGVLEINSKVKVYIGKENPFPKGNDFATIVLKCFLPEDKEIIFSIVGPKRMNYNKNISLLNSLKKCLENL